MTFTLPGPVGVFLIMLPVLVFFYYLIGED